MMPFSRFMCDQSTACSASINNFEMMKLLTSEISSIYNIRSV